jgi:hypothetical protein
VTVAIGGLWAARRADAIVVIGGKPAVDTGMFGIGIGQTARVHILNITDPAVPAPPCNVEVRFFDAQGDLLGESRLSVLPGRAAFADHTDPTLRLGQRKHLRASVLQQPPDPAQPTPACVMTAEARSQLVPPLLLQGAGRGAPLRHPRTSSGGVHVRIVAESALAATDALLALASPRSLGVERRTHSGLVEQQPETAVRLRDLLDRARG